MTDILTKIINTKILEITEGQKKNTISDFEEMIASQQPCRGFYNAINEKLSCNEPAVIAEVKKASPSKGLISKNFNPVTAAQSYQDGGATCLSVLTDEEYFQGHADYLKQARDAVSIPVLRKDFIIDEWQVYESRAMGADCILLIVAALADPQLFELTVLAKELGMDVLMEVHDDRELQRALSTPARLIGINNRNLRTFVTDLETSIHLGKQIPQDRIIISESGIHSSQDISMLRENGINTFLIGEAFMRRENPGAEMKRMFNYA